LISDPEVQQDLRENSSQPVFEGKWLEPGELVTTLVNADSVQRRAEPDATILLRSDLVLNNDEGTYALGGTEQA
jgi:hypothetical protein